MTRQQHFVVGLDHTRGATTERICFDFRAMDEDAARTITAWQYEGQYGFYNMANDPDDLAELNDPTRWGKEYFRVDVADQLAGFWEVIRTSPDQIEVGLGLAPELTGKGLGLPYVLAGIEFTVATTGCRTLTLAVAQFNQRAITVYERAGFVSNGSVLQHSGATITRFLRVFCCFRGSVESYIRSPLMVDTRRRNPWQIACEPPGRLGCRPNPVFWRPNAPWGACGSWGAAWIRACP
jgi:ribosomal-protein-alanine N-acetyltransferase